MPRVINLKKSGVYNLFVNSSAYLLMITWTYTISRKEWGRILVRTRAASPVAAVILTAKFRNIDTSEDIYLSIFS